MINATNFTSTPTHIPDVSGDSIIPWVVLVILAASFLIPILASRIDELSGAD